MVVVMMSGHDAHELARACHINGAISMQTLQNNNAAAVRLLHEEDVQKLEVQHAAGLLKPPVICHFVDVTPVFAIIRTETQS